MNLPTLLMFTIAAVVSGDMQGSTEDILALEDAVVTQRLKMQQWHIHASYNATVGGSAGSPIEVDYYVDGNCYRADRIYRYISGEGHNKSAGGTYKTCMVWNNEERYIYGTRQYADGAKDALEIHSLDSQRHVPIIDIRAVGCHPGGTRVSYPVNEFLGRREMLDRSIEDTKLNGKSCKIVSMRSQDNLQLAFWIAVDEGPGVVKCSAEYMDADKLCVEQMEFTNKFWFDEVWFPQKCRYEMRIGDHATEIEDTEYELLSINQPLEPSCFQIRGLGVTAGTAVYKEPESLSSNLIWDGHAVVPEDRRSPQNRAAEVESKGEGLRWLLLTNGFVLALVAIVCLRRAFRQRPA